MPVTVVSGQRRPSTRRTTTSRLTAAVPSRQASRTVSCAAVSDSPVYLPLPGLVHGFIAVFVLHRFMNFHHFRLLHVFFEWPAL